MRALILVDIQNDFLPGGALAVTGGDQVVPIANAMQTRFDVLVATQDWHPSDHGSFASQHDGREPGETIELSGLQQVLWPDHCVQDTMGADFAPRLEIHRLHEVFRKGTDPAVDSYSGFFDNARRNDIGLDAYLKLQGVEEVFVMGLATDYCVKFTALDALDLGFSTTVIEDGCRGVDLQPGDADKALAEMRDKGVRIARSSELR